jgi:hypothetical protein
MPYPVPHEPYYILHEPRAALHKQRSSPLLPAAEQVFFAHGLPVYNIFLIFVTP